MKIAKLIKTVLFILMVTVVFIGGVLVGNIYDVTDILCAAKANPHILEQDFISKDGILIPEGTVVALRKCAYMQRFNYQFAIDNTIKINRYNSSADSNSSFAELYPDNR